VRGSLNRSNSCRASPPCVELAGKRLAGQSEEAFPQEDIKGSVLGEPLVRQGFGEPEGQNLAGLVALAWHQSRALTLATLSSRVCSLSVRVLTFTVV